MKKYSDIAADIDSKFKEGITLLNEAVEGIEDLIIAFNSSSGDAIDSLVSDLKAAKEKYNSVIETVKQRSSEINERANTYDECLDKWVLKISKNKEAYIDIKNVREGGIKYRLFTYVTDVCGPDAPDGIGYYTTITDKHKILYRTLRPEIQDDSQESEIPPKMMENGTEFISSQDNKVTIECMLGFTGGVWNSIGAMTNALNGTLTGAMAGIGVEIFDDQNTLTIGNNQNDKDFADSQDDEELTDNQDALSTDGNQDNEELADTQDISLTDDNQDDKAPTDTQDSLSTESDGPIEYNTQERMSAATSDVQSFLDGTGYEIGPRQAREFLEKAGYTEQEISYALDNASIDWQERALVCAGQLKEGGDDKNFIRTFMKGIKYKDSEIDYAFKELKIK